jgi:hypothetical protein
MGGVIVGLAALILLLGDEILSSGEGLFGQNDTLGFFEAMQGKWGELRDELLKDAPDDPWYVKAFKLLGSEVARGIDWIDSFVAFILEGFTWIGDLWDDIMQGIDLLPIYAKEAAQKVLDFFLEKIGALKKAVVDFVKSSPLAGLLGLDDEPGAAQGAPGGAASPADLASASASSAPRPSRTARLLGDIAYAGQVLGSNGAVSGSVPTISASPAVAIAAASRGAVVNNSFNMELDASGQNLDEGRLAPLVERIVEDANARASRATLAALTPSLAGG